MSVMTLCAPFIKCDLAWEGTTDHVAEHNKILLPTILLQNTSLPLPNVMSCWENNFYNKNVANNNGYSYFAFTTGRPLSG